MDPNAANNTAAAATTVGIGFLDLAAIPTLDEPALMMLAAMLAACAMLTMKK
jgi:hypothetical protein